MNETLNLTLSTNPAMLLSVAAVVAFVLLGLIGSRVNKLAGTIREKDFSFKPEYSQETGALKWADNDWMLGRCR